MTLNIGLSQYSRAILVTDRLITLADQKTGAYVGDYDVLANKNLVLLLDDAVLAMGYAGTAIIDKAPTDAWLARQIVGRNIEPSVVNAEPVRRWRVGPLMNFLRRSLAAVPGGHGVEVVASGYHWRRGRARPLLLKFSAADPLGPEDKSKAECLSLRRRRDIDPRRTWAGAVAPDWRLLEKRLGAVLAQGSYSEDDIAFAVADLVTDAAARSRTIGRDVMTIRISGIDGRVLVRCSFRPDAQRFSASPTSALQTIPAFFTPYVISSQGVSSPTAMIGAGLSSIHTVGSVDVEFCTTGSSLPLPATDSEAFELHIIPQSRKPTKRHLPAGT